ncbi:GNAT family N-acetyltransferase [Acinetobacter sp. Marseille-Q1618]|uniref:GNAT family N-acetyltransferase n=1 Tax=Acinetobacter sp. Marseille-Q1618 TaxID=2697502 RepID=UPI00157087BF|nr:GNAT family N-acetyltransferase [Acinetobacter sp. Marseille-Q1618]
MIRLATQADITQIAAVHVQSWHETYQGLVKSEILAALNVAQKIQIWTQVFQDDNHCLLVYEKDQKILGFLDGYLPKQKRTVEIRAFYLLKSIQKQGIGRELFKRFYQCIDVEKYDALSLEVFDQNPSRYFYEKLGATLVQVEDAENYGDGLKICHYQWKI